MQPDHLSRSANAVGVMLGGMHRPGLRQPAVRLGGYAVLLGLLLIGSVMDVVARYCLPLAGTVLTLAATAWRRHRPASRAPQHAVPAVGAHTEASVAL